MPRKQGNKNALCSTFSMTQNPTAPMQKKKDQHNGKTHGKPICSASAKSNLCQVHRRVGLKRSSHFIMEEGSSRVGLPVNVVPRLAFRTLILAILRKKKKNMKRRNLLTLHHLKGSLNHYTINRLLIDSIGHLLPRGLTG